MPKSNQDFIENDEVVEFLRYSISDLIREELRQNSFTPIKDIIVSIKEMLDEMVFVIANESINLNLKLAIIKLVSEFNQLARRLVEYRPDVDLTKSNFNRNALITKFKSYSDRVFYGVDQTGQVSNFLTILNSVRTLSLKEVREKSDYLAKNMAEWPAWSKQIHDTLTTSQSRRNFCAKLF